MFEVGTEICKILQRLQALIVDRYKCIYMPIPYVICRLKSPSRRCQNRHTVLTERDKPLEGIPTSGIVKVSL